MTVEVDVQTVEKEVEEEEVDDEEEDVSGEEAGGGTGTGAGFVSEGVIGVDETTLLPFVEKMTRWATCPAGTVTTQNWAPPAPTVPPVHLFTPIVEGLHSQGVPLHPPPGHSMRMAYPGST